MNQTQRRPETGREDYPDYDALWHLTSMGVRKEDRTPNGWSHARADGRRTRVAMIDTSVAVEHPNLAPAINRDLAFDVFSHELGCFAYRDPCEKLEDLGLRTDTNVADGLPGITEILTRLIDRTSHGSLAQIDAVQPCVGAEFSNHGTAIAGLIGARPALVDAVKPDPDAPDAKIPLPYVGVDPFCEIVPISTNFDPDPVVLIVAFLYAELIDADVVLLPRNVPDPARTVPEITRREVNGVPLSEASAPAATTMEDAQLWEELAALIINVSRNRPVICAAGNANEENGIYPANLAWHDNGIISVGALNARGFLAGFSASHSITVMGPSSDAEIFDRSQVRLDTRRAEYDPTGVPEDNDNAKYSHYDVISTDVPGIYGYSASDFTSQEPERGLREFGSYFCSFGGTSAACALVAGYLSLAYSSGALSSEADGLEAKAWLVGNCAEVVHGDDRYAYPAWAGHHVFPDKSVVP